MHNPYGTEAAYYQGLNEGHDPEVAEDLGIPNSADSFERHLESGEIVGELQAVNEALARTAIDGAAEHAAVVRAEGSVSCANCNNPGCPGCGIR
jgi:hypothetical protein